MEHSPEDILFNDEYLTQLHDSTSVRAKLNVQFLQGFLMLKKVKELQLLYIVVYYFNKTTFSKEDKKDFFAVFNDINNLKSDNSARKAWKWLCNEGFIVWRHKENGRLGYVGNEKANTIMTNLIVNKVGDKNFVLRSACVKNFDISLAVIKHIDLFSLVFIEEYLKMQWEKNWKKEIDRYFKQNDSSIKYFRDKRKGKKKTINNDQKNFNIALKAFKKIMNGEEDVFVYNTGQASIVKEMDNIVNENGYSLRFYDNFFYNTISNATIGLMFKKAQELGIIDSFHTSLYIYAKEAYASLESHNNYSENSSALHLKGGKSKISYRKNDRKSNADFLPSPSEEGGFKKNTFPKDSIFGKLPSVAESISRQQPVKKLNVREVNLKSKRVCKLHFDLVFDKFILEEKVKDKFIKKLEKGHKKERRKQYRERMEKRFKGEIEMLEVLETEELKDICEKEGSDNEIAKFYKNEKIKAFVN